jgi:alkylation response protein AidB-like acyl-CoA dehydrogenase
MRGVDDPNAGQRDLLAVKLSQWSEAGGTRVVDHGGMLQVSGGLSRHNQAERHYRDALCGRVHNPQDDYVLTETGKVALQRKELP